MNQMNVPLTPDPAPENIETVTPSLSGNQADDDGQALDDYFEPAFNGPVASETYDLGVEETQKPTRILSNRTAIAVDASPTQILPADPNRLHIKIVADTPIRIASENNEARFAGVLPTGLAWNNDYHTGAVWVFSDSGSGGSNGNVNVWAITE